MLDTFDATQIGDIITVPRRNLARLIKHLKSKEGYSQLIDLCGVDYPARTERFEIVYQLLNMQENTRICVKTHTDEAMPVESVTHLFKAAGWFEREVYDMFGVDFEGNADLRPILTDYGFVGHPLRKDFPLTGYKEVRYDEKQAKIVHEDVHLNQAYRNFDFLSPWEGTEYVLPGDEKAENTK